MRLTLEPVAPSYVDQAVTTPPQSDDLAEATEALRRGIDAAQAGNKTSARTSLLKATELDPTLESAWLWLASLSEYPEELMVFLNNVLDINPDNTKALEWKAATKSLLAKTFVQRGIDASECGNKDFALQCFNQALEQDQSNGMAWLWLSSLCESQEGKISYLEKVLEIEPENKTALAAYANAKDTVNKALLAEARSAAVAGRKADAHELLDAFIAENPESEDGWILRSHLCDSFADKVAALETVLRFNPGSPTARASLDSLMVIFGGAGSEVSEEQSPDGMENTAFAVNAERDQESTAAYEKHPTEELVFPPAALEMAERNAVGVEEAIDEPIVFEPAETEEGVAIAEPAWDAVSTDHDVEAIEASSADPEVETIEAVEVDQSTEFADRVSSLPEAIEQPSDNWQMNTIAFNYTFPGGVDEMSTEEAIPAPFENMPGLPLSFDDPAPSDDELIERTQFVPESFDVKADDYRSIASSFASPFEAKAEQNEAPVEADAVAQPMQFADVSIPMPGDLETTPVFSTTGFETRIVAPEKEITVNLSLIICPFCSADNPSHSFSCGVCLATLTLSDLESLLSNDHADKAVILNAVERLEESRSSRPLSETELTNLGIGYVNIRELDRGYQALQEASHLNPNNVILASQVNSLLIRLDDIRRQEANRDLMPREKKILVVDDSATVRKLIAGKLEKCGHEVFCAADGVEALEQLESVLPDLILLDITMPRMDGYQVCKVIRNKEATKDIPVVMISGKDGFFDKVRGRMAGSSGYITKPFGPETLMKAVETYLKGEMIQ